MTDGPPASSHGPSRADPLVGNVIGERYRVVERLSQGGMGVVYRVEHSLLKSEFALKVLRRPQDSTSKKRFLKEAQIASRVKHPNIVFISDFGVTAEGHSYLVMELLQGRTLTTDLKQGPLPLVRSLRIAMQIARGMQAAHGHGVVHRDLKPDNVFLVTQEGSDDFVKIVDFGIAKDTQRADASESTQLEGAGQGAAASGLTKSGAIVGTPAYMAPEQTKNRPVTPKTDQYAVGCILYHMLTGTPPFVAETQILVLAMHMQDAVQPPSQRAPAAGIPADVEAVVLRLLAKDPSARFESMHELEQVLQQELMRLDPRQAIAAAREEQPTRIAATVPPPRVKGRGLRRIAVGVGVSLLLLGLLVSGWLLRRRGPPAVALSDVRAAADKATQVLLSRSQAGTLPTRLAATQALAAARSAAARDGLLKLLVATESELREEAAAALGRVGERSVLASLQQALAQETSERARLAMADALLTLGERAGESVLQQSLRSENESLRTHAALLLAERGAREAIAVLDAQQAQGRLANEVLLPALYVRAQAGSDEATRILVDRMRRATAQNERIESAGFLTRLGEEEGRQFLTQLASRPNPQQLIAARALAFFAGTGSTDLFRYVLADSQADLPARVAALEGLAAVGSVQDLLPLRELLAPTTAPSLQIAAAAAVLMLAAKDPRIMAVQSAMWARQAIRDPDWHVRQAGSEVLRDSSWSEATALLSSLLNDDQEAVRLSSVRSLGRRSDEPALTALLQGLADSHVAVQQAALLGLLQHANDLRRSPGLTQAVTGRVNALLAGSSPETEAAARSLLLHLGDQSQAARLLSLSASASAAVRSLILESGSGGTELQVRLLSDGSPKVRLAAACRLAARGDRRAVAVLEEAMRQGGPDAIRAYGALLQLGQKLAEPPDLTALITVSLVEQRMAAIEAAATLPVPRAASLLWRAAQDPEPLVRRLVVEVCGDLAPGAKGQPILDVLRRLSHDRDAAVRARAEVVLTRLLHAEPIATLPAEPTPPTPPRRSSGIATERSAPPLPRAGGSGVVLVQANPGVWFQMDSRAWQVTPVPALTLPSGGHRLSSFSGEQTFLVESGRTVTLRLPESEVEKFASAGSAALRRRDYRAAQKNFEKAHALCANNRLRAKPCAQLVIEVAYQLAQAYEALERWPEAMTWYDKLNLPQVRLSPERKSHVQQALARLQPRLGKIVMRRKQAGRCQETTIWMPPGQHVLQVAERGESVVVRAGKVTQVGACL
ncbi:MAG: HEAT repeat domain-containing protein [Myxococcales bacterium]|nr:HEAT repeat domain-containing protein [Myxococcales bacterium]